MVPMVAAAGEAATTLLTSEVISALTNGFSQVQTDSIAGISAALPYGLAIAGFCLSIRLAVGFFRGLAH